ncbi:hypothetical protein [Arthrobacter humicola]
MSVSEVVWTGSRGGTGLVHVTPDTEGEVSKVHCRPDYRANNTIEWDVRGINRAV